ncbi:FAD-dependent oxidoreductase [Pseudoxanthobacter sp. M-2]|uniref:FAD-dependent oxidoreductase n=1 Tax=Pseudoxanthobacter sp. M-2 TaxID=3078754 RepID=UPI0038FD2958
MLLVGGGHSHIEVVRRFGLTPPAGIDLTLVSREATAPYSGMLPGHVAGLYPLDAIGIDLAALCRMAAARGAAVRFEAAAVERIDPDAKTVRTADGRTLAYDILSLNLGSTPSRPGAVGLAVKPIPDFLVALEALRERVAAASRPLRLAVVGAGPAGVELALGLQHRLAKMPAGDGAAVQITLVAASPELLPGRSARTRRLIDATLRRRGIDVELSFEVAAFRDGALVDADGHSLLADEVVWATNATAPKWLRETGLALDEHGFVRVDATLRSLSHPSVFAAGDVASPPGRVSKAGVFAVRQGPVLAHNLRRAATGGRLRRYRPQRHWLALISTADGRAVADKFGLSVSGRWVWHWKDWSDRRFVRRYGAGRP